jgi:NADH:ubiquinone oxidoreductase subunit 6 (subunit J)
MPLIDFLRENWPLLLVPILGIVAVYTLLPRPKQPPVLLGMGAAGLALLLTGFFIVRVAGLTIETCLFYLFGAVAILSGGLLVTQQNPARAALSFALVILATCGLFLLQAGPFLMAATIIVYAGAIIVTFVFVIMLAQQQGLSDADARSREPFLASLTGFLLLFALFYILQVTYKPGLASWVESSKEKLRNIQLLREKGKPSAEEITALVKELEQFRSSYERWWRNQWLKYDPKDSKSQPKTPPAQGKPLSDKLLDVESALPKDESKMGSADLDKIEKEFVLLCEVGEKMQKNPLLGSLRPNSPRLSELSGPSSQHGSEQLRRDEMGRPHLPAENTAYLGRSLFSDYLLSVELAGMLLLVATVGAIAIAQRHGAHSPTARTNRANSGRTA